MYVAFNDEKIVVDANKVQAVTASETLANRTNVYMDNGRVFVVLAEAEHVLSVLGWNDKYNGVYVALEASNTPS